jgi:hypothetical protein
MRLDKLTVRAQEVGRFKRAIHRLIQDPPAPPLLNGAFVEGDTVIVNAKRGQRGFRKAVEAHPV